jgi:hypothetical protein
MSANKKVTKSQPLLPNVPSVEDIAHFGKVVTSLRETIRLMGEVDGVIESAGGWPIK